MFKRRDKLNARLIQARKNLEFYEDVKTLEKKFSKIKFLLDNLKSSPLYTISTKNYWVSVCNRLEKALEQEKD